MDQNDRTSDESSFDKLKIDPERKKPKEWKTYILEFIMIFLAVSLGFIAEELRQNRNETRLENEFAVVLFNELLSDSVQASEILNLRIRRESDIDYIVAFFKDSSLIKLPREFYPKLTTSLFLSDSYKFEPKEGILNELRNSGASQYFKNITFQKLLGDMNADVSSIRARSEQDYQYYSNPIKPFLVKHYDFSWLNKLQVENPDKRVLEVITDYAKGSRTISGEILNLNSLDRIEAVNMILFYKSLLRVANTRQL
ncbi:MAG: hypothetical protein K2U26_12190 [Cyclobacteriaceae bacterium]|nr:hypothetical protein [Cyclobacteriaceae bacterium]